MRQRRDGRDLFVLLECQRRPGAEQEQHTKNEGANIAIQHTQDPTKRDESFHAERCIHILEHGAINNQVYISDQR